MVNSTSLLTKFMLLGKHENLNVNPNVFISALYAPKATETGALSIYDSATHGKVDIHNEINYLDQNMNQWPSYLNHTVTFPTGKVVYNKVTANPQYWMGIYNDNYYQQFANTSDFASDPLAERTDGNYESHPQDIYDQTDFNRKELLGYNTDLGALSAFLVNQDKKYGVADQNPDDQNPNSMSTNARASEINSVGNQVADDGQSLGWTTTNADGETITFGDIEDSAQRELTKTGLSAWVNSLAGIFPQMSQTQSGADLGTEILNMLLFLVDDGVGAGTSSLMNFPLTVLGKLFLSFVMKHFESLDVSTLQDPNNNMLKIKAAMKTKFLSTAYSAVNMPFLAVPPGVELIANEFDTDVDVLYQDQTSLTKSDPNGLTTIVEGFSALQNLIADNFSNGQIAQINNEIIDLILQKLSSMANGALLGKDPVLKNEINAIISALTNAKDDNGDYKFNLIDMSFGWNKLFKSLLPIQDKLAQYSFINATKDDNDQWKGKGYLALSTDQKTLLTNILGWNGQSFKTDSPLDVLYKSFNDNSQVEYDDLTYLIVDSINSPLLNSAVEPMKTLDSKVLQYAVGPSYWHLSNEQYHNDAQETLSYTLEYTGVGDSSVTNFETKSNIEKIKTINGKYFDGFYNLLNHYKNEDGTDVDEKTLIAYSGLGMSTDMVNVSHKYEVEWTNLGSAIKPMWVITKLNSYVRDGEIANGVGSTATGDWTQIYFKF